MIHKFYNILVGVLILVCSYNQTFAQNVIRYNFESQSTITTNDVVPFWFRSNNFGSNPNAGLSQSFIGSAYKEYTSESLGDSVNNKKFDEDSFKSSLHKQKSTEQKFSYTKNNKNKKADS